MKDDRRRCPRIDKLKDFSLGKGSSAAIESIGQHLAECSSCEAAVEHFHESGDSFLDYLQGQLEVVHTPEESEFRSLKKRLWELPHEIYSHFHGQSLSDELPDVSAVNGRPIPERLGQYRLLELVGRGGMSIVYKATHTKLKRDVAIKILLPKGLDDRDAVARFELEMEAIGQIDEHPNIVRAHDAGEINGHHILVMDYVEGIDGSQLSCRIGKLSAADACEIVHQAALGLQYAHEHHIVHRDVKPANLILTKAGEVKLLDLGLAVIRENANLGELTTANMIVGTADYMSPEQWRDSSQADTRADVYGLGCTLFKLLIGHAPYSHTDNRPRSKMKAHLKAPIPSVSELRPTLPAGLDEVVTKMLAKNPADRFTTPGEVATAMEPFTSNSNLRDLVGRTYVPTSDTHSKGLDATRAMRSVLVSVQQRFMQKKVRLSFLLIALLLVFATSLGTFLGSSLNTDKVELLFPDMQQQILTQVDSSHDTVHVQTKERTLIIIGTTAKSNYTVSTNIDQKDWQGGAGIYIGHKAQELNVAMTHTLETITLSRINSDPLNSAFEIARNAVMIYAPTGAERTWVVTPVATEQVSIDYSRANNNLAVEVHGGRLSRVLWNGNPLEKLTVSQSSESQVLGAGYGLFNSKGPTSFHDTRLN